MFWSYPPLGIYRECSQLETLLINKIFNSVQNSVMLNC